MAVRVGRADLRTRRLIAFALLAALLATFLTDYRYAEVAFEEIDPIIRRAMDPNHLTNDFFTNTADDFGPRFYSTKLIAAVATPGSLPAIYFALTLLINFAIAVLTALIARDLFKSNVAGLFAVALVMGATSFQLGGAGQAHANEPNSSWMSFPFALAAVWAATRARPLIVGLIAGVASLLHPTFGASVGGLLFLSLIVSSWIRRRDVGTPIPLVGIGSGLLLFAGFLALVAVPYSGGARIPEEQLFDIMRVRMPHHLLPSTFDLSDWTKGLLFMVALGIAWRWLRRENLPERFPATLLASLVAGIFSLFVGGYLFVEVWPWKPWFLAIPYRSTSFLLWLGLLVIGGNAARRAAGGGRAGEVLYLQSSSFNPISAGLAHLIVLVKERRNLTGPLLVASGIGALVVGGVFTEPRDLVQFTVINGLAFWFLAGPDRPWASVVGIGAPLLLAAGLFTFQTLVHRPGVIDRVGPEILPSQVEGSEADMARAAKELTPSDSVILTPPSFGTFRVLSDRAIVVDTRDIPYQEDAMAEWMDRIITLYGTPDASGLENQDFGREEYEALDEAYLGITDETIQGLCSRYSITHAVLFLQTETAYPVLDQDDTYQLVEINNCP